jgi:secondary thiamine-phosphate synthase enzyme
LIKSGEKSLILTRNLEFDTSIGDVIDITERVAAAIRECGVHSGIAVVFVPGATAAVTTIEHEPGLVDDIRAALERIVPEEIQYSHDRKWGDGNGHSHIRASLIGPSLTVPFQDDQLMLGTWQQIVFLELDNRPRKRRIIVQILGE